MTTPSDPAGARTPRGDWRDGLPAGARLPPGFERADLPAVDAIRFDSRAVRPGDAFVCVEGERFDGHAFAARAAEAGAAVLIAKDGRGEALRAALDVPVLEVPDPRRALSSLADANKGYPARRLTVIGITGTDGKSTTAFLAHAALEACGVRAGLLTTIGTRVTPGAELTSNATRLTTQEAPVVQALLAEMVDAGCTHAVVEATSHGLALDRLADCEFDIAVLTNLTSDHLDFHGTFEAYRAAKLRLFSMLTAPTSKRVRRVAIVNRDDRSWERFAKAAQGGSVEVLTYGLRSRGVDLRARDVLAWPDGSTFSLVTDEWEIDASVPLPGAFNVLNATAAIAIAAALDLDPMAAASGVARATGVPGRMQRLEGAPFPVIVDYAHTPEAMRQVLAELTPLVEGRVIVVFGCAGERSPDRRTGLGKAVAGLGAYAVLTEEDPRSEDPAAILEEIAGAMTAAGAAEGERFERVPDRRDAIARALAIATPSDLVLLAGKGHESTIERASGAIPWNEARTAAELIEARFGASSGD
ncbi:MAG: UDP-N-acetylmuramoyl-L-alanyl-D-glutamate--2,6-diaminopimelate ligase [Dehalococcoidia bacterium]